MANEELLDQLAAQNAQLREALVELSTGSFPNMQAVFNVAHEALAAPDLFADWLRKHDAAVLRKAATFYSGTMMFSESSIQKRLEIMASVLENP